MYLHIGIYMYLYIYIIHYTCIIYSSIISYGYRFIAHHDIIDANRWVPVRLPSIGAADRRTVIRVAIWPGEGGSVRIAVLATINRSIKIYGPPTRANFVEWRRWRCYCAAALPLRRRRQVAAAAAVETRADRVVLTPFAPHPLATWLARASMDVPAGATLTEWRITWRGCYFLKAYCGWGGGVDEGIEMVYLGM